MMEMTFELKLDNISGLLQATYESAVIIPKKKVAPNALTKFTSELYKVTPVLDDISAEELEKILENSAEDMED